MPNPKHYYDCDNCKFSWCCGYACSCICGLKKNLPLPPKEVQDKVDAALVAAGLEVQDWEDVR